MKKLIIFLLSQILSSAIIATLFMIADSTKMLNPIMCNLGISGLGFLSYWNGSFVLVVLVQLLQPIKSIHD